MNKIKRFFVNLLYLPVNIRCLGFVSGIRYNLGIAQEGVDFITLGDDDDE